VSNSLAVWRVLKQDVLGNQIRNGLTDTYLRMPDEVDDRMEEAAAAILERVASAVDWERLLEEAYWRHGEAHEEDWKPQDRRVTTADVCGECLREALLSEQRYSPNWGEHPSTPLTRQKLDWPQVVADVLQYRAVANWHPYKEQEASK
jgi:hypothetical protein